MSRRQWTLLVVSDTETTVRQYRFSKEVVRLAIAIVLVGVSTFSSVATALVMKQREPLQTVRLEQKNRLLQSEIKDIRKQVTSLDAHLDNLAKQDEHFRLVAGLEPLSADVQRVGIGGPGGEPEEASALRTIDRGAAVRFRAAAGIRSWTGRGRTKASTLRPAPARPSWPRPTAVSRASATKAITVTWWRSITVLA